MMVSQILYYRITNEQSEYSESNSNDQCLESQHQQSSASSSTDRLISPGAPVTEDALLVPPIPDSAIQSSENNVGNSTVITTTTATTIASRTRKLGNWKYYTWLVGTITTVVVLIWTYYYALFRPLPSNEGKSILKPPKNDMESIAKLLGYISAFVYIWSYVFQAYQNWKAKSTEGLSIFLFIFTVGGNMTYCFSILVVSLDPEYLALYQPWLLGA
ncbi:hypothetical protein H4219_003112 [Mycoemilia scoparia]|uniref:Uncharacterized protein n=1 Tax=Mycoemilia scoparia TaxID=417184 RepID=A0A9W8A0Z4_9FUNG|nr:hypothetical protein H4219_003112 [Mycoemilia scoparia]